MNFNISCSKEEEEKKYLKNIVILCITFWQKKTIYQEMFVWFFFFFYNLYILKNHRTSKSFTKQFFFCAIALFSFLKIFSLIFCLVFDRVKEDIKIFCANNTIDDVYNTRFLDIVAEVQGFKGNTYPGRLVSSAV